MKRLFYSSKLALLLTISTTLLIVSCRKKDVVSPPTSIGTIYIGSDDGRLYAIDANNGLQKWSYKTSGAIQSTPIVSNGVVYFGSNNDTLYAVNTNGTLKWKFTTGDDIVSSPIVYNGFVYVGSNDGKLYAIDANTGTAKAGFPFTVGGGNGDITSSPIVYNGFVYVGSDDQKLYAVDANTGVAKSGFVIPTLGGFVQSSPIANNGILYIGSGNDNLGRSLYAVDANTGTIKGGFPVNFDNPLRSSPIFYNGTIYISSDSGRVYAVDALTGMKKPNYNSFDMGDFGDPSFYSSPTISDDKIYIGSNGQNKVFALNATTGNKIWEFQAEGSTQSSPIVYQGIVYIGGDAALYALDATNGTKKWEYLTRDAVFSSPCLVTNSGQVISWRTIRNSVQ